MSGSIAKRGAKEISSFFVDFWKEDKLKNQRIIAVVLMFTGFITGGFIGVYASSMQLQAGAIAGFTAPDQIEVGTWFRYELNNFWGMSAKGWTSDGGKPYLIVNCTEKTDYKTLGDATVGSENGVAYKWDIKVYWENGMEAIELMNGSLNNEHYKFLMKTIIDSYNGRNDTQIPSFKNYLRPWINPSLNAWNTKITPDSEAVSNIIYNLLWLKTIPLSTSNTIGLSYKSSAGVFSDIGGTSNAGGTFGIQMAYEKDTGILIAVRVYDWMEAPNPNNYAGTQNGNEMLYISSYGKSGNATGTTNIGGGTPVPAAPVVTITNSTNTSYETVVKIDTTGVSSAIVNITSQTPGFNNITNLTTTSGIIPVDVKNDTNLTVIAVLNNGGLISEPGNATETVVARTGTKASNVTLLSAEKIGNSVNLTWSEDPDASQYRVLINDTQFGEPVIGNNCFVQPDIEGYLNFTVVVDSKVYDESSDQSNGIIVNFTSEGLNILPAFSGAVEEIATSLTDVEAANAELMALVPWIVVAIVGFVGGGISVVYLFLMSRKKGKTVTGSQKKRDKSAVPDGCRSDKYRNARR